MTSILVSTQKDDNIHSERVSRVSQFSVEDNQQEGQHPLTGQRARRQFQAGLRGDVGL